MMNLRMVALLAGVGFLGLAAITQGVLPMLEPQSRTKKVTRVVRTDLGQLKWSEYQATDYTPIEALGRQVYLREGCWYCHSQFVRPTTGETMRWGPVSQAGEYAFDIPHLFSTRRIGPDLTRVGLKYSDEWHYAHFWDPRTVVPDSIMPSFAGLFEAPDEPVMIVTDEAGNRTLERNELTERFFDFDKREEEDAHLLLTPNAEGLLFIPEHGRYPVIITPNDEYTGDAVRLVVNTEELRGLVAYLQKLGMNRGKWRDRFEPQLMAASGPLFPKSEEWIERGKEVYERRCLGCHGVTGDGNGPAATFMYQFRPRDFRLGLFKFTKTTAGSLPTDGDLLRTITRGVRGTAMPTWHNLPLKDRLAVIQYIKFELSIDRSQPDFPYAWFEEEEPEEPIHIGAPPIPSEDLLARGEEVWQQAKCWECHGDTGKGDGPKSDELDTDWGFPIEPADLTIGQFKSGPGPDDIFRTMSTGLGGTPMPSYEDSLSERDRWALSYYVLALSAFKDPLTGEPLEFSAEDRAALNDPGLEAPNTRRAYALKNPLDGNVPKEEGQGPRYAGDAWAERRGLQTMAAPRTGGRQEHPRDREDEDG
jgi:cytochrome c oxidase cbb3-type subunit 2